MSNVISAVSRSSLLTRVSESFNLISLIFLKNKQTTVIYLKLFSPHPLTFNEHQISQKVRNCRKIILHRAPQKNWCKAKRRPQTKLSYFKRKTSKTVSKKFLCVNLLFSPFRACFALHKKQWATVSIQQYWHVLKNFMTQWCDIELIANVLDLGKKN